jgi:hypothetical protein
VGYDTLLVIKKKKIPFETIVKKKMTVTDLQKQYKNDMVFLRNKNLQHSEKQLKGGIVWIPYLQKVVLILKARGTKAYVEVLYPKEQEPQCFVLSMLLQGFYLQQIHGRPLVNQFFKAKNITKRGLVVPLLDQANYLKMDTTGPDVAYVKPNIKMDKDDQKELMTDPFVILNQQKLPKYDPVGCQVLYVYPRKQKYLRKVIGHKLLGVPLSKQQAVKIGTGR